jgi:hypothetical protein
LIVVYLYGKNNSLFLGSSGSHDPVLAPTIKILDTPTPTPTPMPTPIYIAPTVDPDPPVLCNVNPNCGGGTTPLRQSECNNSTCCQIGDKWIFYKDKVQCGRDQVGKNSGASVPVQQTLQNSNKTPVFLSYGGYTVYCPAQNVGAVMSINSTMESKKTQWATDYNACTDTFFKTNSCYVSCKSTDGSGWSACSYGSPDYDTCMKQASDNYSGCISKCPSSADACNWVYFEQKSLTSQINNLCN